MNKCSNCLIESKEVVRALIKREYYVCPKCSVTYGKDRFGNTFLVDEEVHMKPGFSSKMDGRIFVITGIFIFEECESGRIVTLNDKETGRPFKSEVDINWLRKIKN